MLNDSADIIENPIYTRLKTANFNLTRKKDTEPYPSQAYFLRILRFISLLLVFKSLYVYLYLQLYNGHIKLDKQLKKKKTKLINNSGNQLIV